MKKSVVLTDMKEPERAILALREAEELVDPERNHRRLLCIREVMAALAVFQAAAGLDAVTADLARDLAGYLSRARQEPGLRFERG